LVGRRLKNAKSKSRKVAPKKARQAIKRAPKKAAQARKAIPKAVRRKAAGPARVQKAGKAATPLKAGKAAKAQKIAPPEPPRPRLSTVEEQALMKRVVTILSDGRIRQDLIEVGGENALAIIRNFSGNQSDEDLAKRLKIKISDVRATLNKLHNEGLVNYIREKDSETGWYSYSWSLNHERMERWASNHNCVAGAISAESGCEYYFCPSCGTESITNFESAACCEFRCERCNKMMEFIDDRGIAELFEKKK
jgi:transcription factor E